jgi:hypothetical protein
MPKNTGTVRRSFTRRAARLLLTLVLALGLTGFASLTQQASAAGFAPANNEVWHQCVTIGTLSNGNQANVCNDLWIGPGSGGTEFWGTTEYYCQGPSQQCKGINANNTITSSLYGTIQNRAYSCTNGGCPNGARAMVSTPHFTIPTGTQNVDVATTVTTSAAILVNGTSTAYHPKTAISKSGTFSG